MTLRYRLLPVTARPQSAAVLRLTLTVSDALGGFAGFALLAKESEPPGSLDDGVELFRWAPGDDAVEGDHEADVDLDVLRRRRWSQCFCKLVVLDPAQRPVTLVIHPNTCNPLPCDGGQEGDSENAPVYRFGGAAPYHLPPVFRGVSDRGDALRLLQQPGRTAGALWLVAAFAAPPATSAKSSQR